MTLQELIGVLQTLLSDGADPATPVSMRIYSEGDGVEEEADISEVWHGKGLGVVYLDGTPD